MIGLDGEKMSKSRGNLVFVSRLRGDGVDPMAIRLALLSGPLPHRPRLDGGPAADGGGAAGHLAAGRGADAGRGRRAACWPGCASGSPTTSTAPARSRWSTRGPRADPGRWTPTLEEEAPRIVCDAVDALLRDLRSGDCG